jgi:lipoic acid synthetase
MTTDTDTGLNPAYNALDKQKGASKTSRIPIKIVPIADAERLKKPDWIRVKAATASSRFYEIKYILRSNKLVTGGEVASCPTLGDCFG